jgi:hypothetical protein
MDLRKVRKVGTSDRNFVTKTKEIQMDERESEAMARYEAAVLAARGRALQKECTREEMIEAVLADPEVVAVGCEPAVRHTILTQEAERLLRMEPDLLRATENGYPGARERLLSKIRMKLRRKRMAGRWRE